MDFFSKNQSAGVFPVKAADALFAALAAGDVSSAFILTQAYEKAEADAATVFNRALCLYLLDEWEKALRELNRAEIALTKPQEAQMQDKRLVKKALEVTGERFAILPLCGEVVGKSTSLALVRIKWLSVRCLKNLGRNQEAMPIVHWLETQYGIKA